MSGNNLGNIEVDSLSFAKWFYSVRPLRPGSHIDGLYSDPAWDILLDLYIREKSRVPTSVSSACIAARAPATTALRYISSLGSHHLIERQPDDKDKRRHWLKLSPGAMGALEEFMAAAVSSFSPLAADASTEVDFAEIANAIRKASARSEQRK